MFETESAEKNKRIGKLYTKSGVIQTPFFMPIATKGAVKNLMPEELKNLRAEIILGNAYHLWLRPGDKLIKKAGDLHKFVHWDKPILTDSGGFQIFSLGARAKKKFGKNGVVLSDKGVKFTDPVVGKKYFMSPEKSIEIQLNLGSDIVMVLDECPSYPCSWEDAKAAVKRTTEWAKRCFKYFYSEIKKNGKKYKNSKPLLFCIIQGSIYKDLRELSARQLKEIDFSALGGTESGWDGYAIGGVAVGEPREKMKDILDWVLPILPQDKPRYLMGLGRPEEIFQAVKAGIDMFDCVIPTREGRHGRLFLRKNNFQFKISGEKISINKKDLFYETININNKKYREDFTPVDKNCDCLLCQNYTRSYLRHLFTIKEPLALRLSSIHNLKFYLDLMKELQK